MSKILQDAVAEEKLKNFAMLNKDIFVSSDVTARSMLEYLGFDREIDANCFNTKETFEDEYQDESCKHFEVCITIKEIK